MIDKGLDRMLVGLFGTTGMAILIFAGTQTMPLADRLLTIAVGLVGLVWVLVRVLSWKSRQAETA
jgi:amino acid permease